MQALQASAEKGNKKYPDDWCGNLKSLPIKEEFSVLPGAAATSDALLCIREPQKTRTHYLRISAHLATVEHIKELLPFPSCLLVKLLLGGRLLTDNSQLIDGEQQLTVLIFK